MIFHARLFPSTVPLVMLALAGATSIQAAPADAVVYVDCERGNDANSGLTPDVPKRTVGAALHSAPDGGARSLVVTGACGDRTSFTPSTDVIKGHRCATDLKRGVVVFKLKFAQTPDFFTLNGEGAPATSFQYYVEAARPPAAVGDFYSAAAGQGDASTKSILRGEEIHVDGDLRVRGIVPFWDEPGSGGWGPIVDEVPYTLEDGTVTFEVPLSSLKDTGDGQLWYLVEGYLFGSWDGVTLAGSCRGSNARQTRPAR